MCGWGQKSLRARLRSSRGGRAPLYDVGASRLILSLRSHNPSRTPSPAGHAPTWPTRFTASASNEKLQTQDYAEIATASIASGIWFDSWAPWMLCS